MGYGYVTASVDVSIDELLEEADTDDLIAELERRGNEYNSFVDADEAREKLTKIWQLRREGKDYDKELDDLIYYVLGKVI
jgi:hypothetical protein